MRPTGARVCGRSSSNSGSSSLCLVWQRAATCGGVWQLADYRNHKQHGMRPTSACACVRPVAVSAVWCVGGGLGVVGGWQPGRRRYKVSASLSVSEGASRQVCVQAGVCLPALARFFGESSDSDGQRLNWRSGARSLHAMRGQP